MWYHRARMLNRSARDHEKGKYSDFLYGDDPEPSSRSITSHPTFLTQSHTNSATNAAPMPTVEMESFGLLQLLDHMMDHLDEI